MIMKLNRLTILCCVLLSTFFFSCNKEKKQGGGISDQAQVEANLNSGLILPAGSFTVDPDLDGTSVDNSITVGANSGAPMALQVGQTASANIPFNAPNGNVTAIGMRFGSTGPINFVPINTNNATSGTGSFQFQVTAEMCNNLSKICHDVRCYEFAYTSSGQVSQANLNQIALMCGNCDEPSCRGLIDENICAIDCDLLNASDGSGIYLDRYLDALQTFSDNPTEQNCNAYYDSVIFWYEAIRACTGQQAFQGESLDDLITQLKEDRNSICTGL